MLGRRRCGGNGVILTMVFAGGAAEFEDAAQKIRPIFGIELARRGLQQGVRCPHGQRGQSGFRALCGQRRYDEDLRVFCFRENFRQGLESAHAGHFEIQQDHVGRRLVERCNRLRRTVCARDQFEPRILTDHALQHGSRNQRIIDNHHPYPGGVLHSDVCRRVGGGVGHGHRLLSASRQAGA